LFNDRYAARRTPLSERLRDWNLELAEDAKQAADDSA
jgi:hypothetical protein